MKIDDKNSFINFLILNMDTYSKKYSSKTIRKNVTLPQWVNTLGEKHHANFSKVLQEAIVERYVM